MNKSFLTLLLVLFPLFASANPVEIDGIYYNLNSNDGEKVASVTSNPNYYSGDIVIPESVAFEDLVYNVTSIEKSAFYDCIDLKSVVIPSSVISIGLEAFWNCSNLISVDIPNSVTSIGRNAFNRCSCLISVILPNNLSIIEPGTFYNCSSLISVIIPNSVTSIEESAFSGCSSLTSITLTENVNTIGGWLFYDCSSLTTIYVKITDYSNFCNNKLMGQIGGIGIPITLIDSDGNEINEFTIPNDVTSIGDSSFRGCKGLTSVVIPNSVISIGSWAFRDCSSLVSLTIPNSVTSIDDYAFYGCNGLISVVIPNSVTSISKSVFSNCSSLTSITIPNSISSIGDYAFFKCSSLTSVIIPENITSIGESAFSGCDLTEISLPSNLQIIKSGTFSSCGNLENIIIPASVEYIYQNAFAECNSLKSIKSLAETPPFLYDNSFSNFDIPLYVPEVSIDSYKAKDGWKKFKDILSIEAAKFTLTYMVDGEVYKTFEVYEGTTIVPEAEPTKEGYEFSGWSTIPATMPAEDVTITGTFKVQADEDVIKITSVGQTTWCSKYDLDFTDVEGLKAYIASGYHRTKGTIWLTRVKEVPAGEGILLIGDEGEYKVPHKSTTAYYANLMVGTVKAITINETDGEYTNYYLSNGASGVGFYKVNGSVDIKANRAYLPLLKNTVSGSRGFIGMDFDDDEDGTTGISEAQQRVGEQDVYYNLQGQRVDNPSKGIYIRNGKKVVIK